MLLSLRFISQALLFQLTVNCFPSYLTYGVYRTKVDQTEIDHNYFANLSFYRRFNQITLPVIKANLINHV